MNRVFCTYAESYGLRSFRGARYGRPWTPQDISALAQCIADSLPLVRVCEALQRPSSGVISKACWLRMLTSTSASGSYTDVVYTVNGRVAEKVLASFNNAAPIKENVMATEKNIETLVMIQGENAASKSDTQLYQLIAKLEGQIKTLTAIENKPKKLQKTLAELQRDIDQIVAYVDSRE